ncbi:hypothetical protein H312_03443, partial [Anncaliia algerae PRA339]
MYLIKIKFKKMANEYYEKLITMNDDEFLNYLFQKSLVKNAQNCSSCGVEMILKYKKEVNEKYTWRCINSLCCNYKTTRTLRYGSFFQDFRLPIREILKCIYSYAIFPRQKDIKIQTFLSKNFIINIRNRLIQKFREYFRLNPIKLGGSGVTVHVDETKLNFNVKSHRGHSPSEPSWALVFADTSYFPSRGYVELVENRKSSTLLEVINRVVLPHSIIYTDEWPSYANINQNEAYLHRTVTHKYHFVDPTTGVHTQNVESYNNKLKYKIKMVKGVRKEK